MSAKRYAEENPAASKGGKRRRTNAPGHGHGQMNGGTQESKPFDPVAQEASVKAYMFHARKLLYKSLKKSKAFEIQKLVRKAKAAGESKDGEEAEEEVIKLLAIQLVYLKKVELDSVALQILHARLPKLRFLHQFDIKNFLPPSDPLPELESSTPEGKARNKVLANKVVKEAWDEIAHALAKRIGVQLPPVAARTGHQNDSSPGETGAQTSDKGKGKQDEPASGVQATQDEQPVKRLSKRAERAAKGAAAALLRPLKTVVVDPARQALINEQSGSQGGNENKRVKSTHETENEFQDLENDLTSELDDDFEIQAELDRIGEGSGHDADSDEAGWSSGSEDADPATVRTPNISTITSSTPEKSAVKIPRISRPLSTSRTAPITTSAFLPTLASGYVSYSDSDGEDAKWIKEAEKGEKKERKNRRGQRARQAIWEKKYGSGANHVAKATGATPAIAKGGSKGSTTRKGARDRDASQNATAVDPRYAPFDPSTTRPGAENNPNTQPVADRRVSGKASLGVGTTGEKMHPSWEAKRKQAELLQNIATAPKGKKITFD